MSTIGLSFGSATSGTGFDVAATVTSILAIAQGVETPWKAQLTSLQAQDTALTGLGGSLSSLSTAVNALTDFAGVMASKQGSSSATNVLTLASASPSAIAGSHTIMVTSLAETSSRYSDEIAQAGDTLSGNLTIQVGSGTAQTLTIDSGSNTLSTLANAINIGSYGVTASVVSDTNGSRLSLVSNTSGSAGTITTSGSLMDTNTAATVGFSRGLQGLDAHLNVDGLDTTSASNTVTGAIPGVTFQLLAPSASAVQVEITNNNSSVETAVQTMVTAYNAVVAGLKTQEGKDANGQAEPLFGSPTLALIQEQLSSSLLGGASSGTVTNIGQLGITLAQDGTLSLSVSTLDSVLNSHFGDVAGFLQNTGSFGQTMSKTLDTLGSGTPGGAITLALLQDASVTAGLNLNITNEEALIASQRISLTKELNTANQILQSIPAQLNDVNEIYSAITGYSKTH